MSDEGVSLKEYFEQRLMDQNRRLDERFAATEEAIRKAERAVELRLIALNELRNVVTETLAHAATKSELQTLERTVIGIDKRVFLFGAVAGAGSSIVTVIAAQLLLKLLTKG